MNENKLADQTRDTLLKLLEQTRKKIADMIWEGVNKRDLTQDQKQDLFHYCETYFWDNNEAYPEYTPGALNIRVRPIKRNSLDIKNMNPTSLKDFLDTIKKPHGK